MKFATIQLYTLLVLLFICFSCCLVVCCSPTDPKKEKEIISTTSTSPPPITTIVPKQPYFSNIIYQTTKTKENIPDKVYQQMQKYAPTYQHVIFDDKECIQYLQKHFGKKHVQRFHQLPTGAHKADLFRYCLLYKEGGIYMDIKTELIQPVDEIFVDRTKLYCVMQFDKQGIYQGVLASPAGNPIFLELIEYVLKTDPSHYLEYTHDFYRRLQKYPPRDVIVFEERCHHDAGECKGLDRYGFCCHVYWKGKKIIKTRFNDYPW